MLRTIRECLGLLEVVAGCGGTGGGGDLTPGLRLNGTLKERAPTPLPNPPRPPRPPLPQVHIKMGREILFRNFTLKNFCHKPLAPPPPSHPVNHVPAQPPPLAPPRPALQAAPMGNSCVFGLQWD